MKRVHTARRRSSTSRTLRVIGTLHGVLTPTLTGAQPAVFTVNGQTVRPLGPENDQALALLAALALTR